MLEFFKCLGIGFLATSGIFLISMLLIVLHKTFGLAVGIFAVMWILFSLIAILARS